EQVRSLTAVRDLVAVLPRDQSVDVMPLVMEKIQGQRPAASRSSRLLVWPSTRPRWLAAAGLLAAAAGVVLAISLPITPFPGIGPGDRAINRRAAVSTVVANPTRSATDAVTTADVRDTHSPSSDSIPSDTAADRASDESGSLALAGELAVSEGSIPALDLKHI